MSEKLVRDEYEEKFPLDGASFRRVTSSQEHDKLLSQKHLEELQELEGAIASGDPKIIAEEAGDLIESVYERLNLLHGVSRTDIEKARREKKKEKGGFKKGVILKTED